MKSKPSITHSATIKTEDNKAGVKLSVDATIEAPDDALLLGLEPIPDLVLSQRLFNNIPEDLAYTIAMFTGLPVHDNMLLAYTRYLQATSVLAQELLRDFVQEPADAVTVARINNRLNDFHKIHVDDWASRGESTDLRAPTVSLMHMRQGNLALQVDTRLNHVIKLITCHNMSIAEFEKPIPKVVLDVTVLPVAPAV